MTSKIRAGRQPKAGRLPKVPWKTDFRRNWVVYALFIPVAAYFILFNYIPMVGITIAFEDFKVSQGIFGSDWVGLQNFVDLFTGDAFPLVIRNTVMMALLGLTLGFAAPVVLALIISEMPWKGFRRGIQTMSYMPNFVAAVVVAALVREFLGTSGGITQVLALFGLPVQNWVANPNIPVFWLINTFADIWQSAGFGTIVYIAAIGNVSGDLFEAAAIDGANRWQRLTRITLPSILPLIIMLLTLRIGLVFVMGFEKILLLYMPATYDVADVLVTYTYRMAFGSGGGNFGLSAASGLFQSVVGTFLLLTSNYLNRRVIKYSLF